MEAASITMTGQESPVLTVSVWAGQGKFGFILGSHACCTQNRTKVNFFSNTDGCEEEEPLNHSQKC